MLVHLMFSSIDQYHYELVLLIMVSKFAISSALESNTATMCDIVLNAHNLSIFLYPFLDSTLLML